MSTVAGGGIGSVDGNGVNATFNNPKGIIKVGDNYYITDFGNSKIRNMTSTFDVTTVNCGYSFSNPTGITYDSFTNCLIIANTGNSSIVSLNIDTCGELFYYTFFSHLKLIEFFSKYSYYNNIAIRFTK